MLTGVVVSASNFLCVVIILYFFIFSLISVKTKNPANEVRRVSYLGLQLINRSDQKHIRLPKLIGPPADIFMIDFDHSGHKFIKKIELANFLCTFL